MNSSDKLYDRISEDDGRKISRRNLSPKTDAIQGM